MERLTGVEDSIATFRAWWPEVRLGEPLGGGNRNLILGAEIDGQRVVARSSRRSAASLGWELELLAFLDRSGLRVPRPFPASDGALHHDSCCLLSWVDGEPPETAEEWRQVAETLSRLHRLTLDWPQRPDFASTVELVTREQGGDVDLRLMPQEAVNACRRAWDKLRAEPVAVIHGDPGAANLRISREGVGLLDWDEARRDAAILDFVAMPFGAGERFPPERMATARIAADAWEAANGWQIEPDYARRRLAALLAAE